MQTDDVDQHVAYLIVFLAIEQEEEEGIHCRFICIGLIRKVATEVLKNQGGKVQEFLKKSVMACSPEDREDFILHFNSTWANIDLRNVKLHTLENLLR